ncbi:MAG: ankyrin repeat domain-containing protein [Deltaproteobacteria bacterium]
MVTFLKVMLAAFMLAGLAFALYGGWEILSTIHFVKDRPERAKGVFAGYDDVEVVSRSSTTNAFSQLDFQDTTSYMSYPEFEFVGKDGQTRRVRESKHHLISWFKPGQEVEIIVSPYGDHRLAGFYSLYVLDLSILALGLLFILIPFILYRGFIPMLDTAAVGAAGEAGGHLVKFAEDQFRIVAALKAGPITVGTLLKGTAYFFAVVLMIAAASAILPYLKQMRLGFDYALLEALEQDRFEVARELIAKKKGINRTDEYDQTPLILALQKQRPDLARALVEAGADVNVKSETLYRTALQVATQSGDARMVRLLLAKGAKPDADEDESPPIFIAILKGHDEIARALIESGCDLRRQYTSGGKTYTVGDLAVIAQKPALVELIRKRGGVFTRTP